MLKKMVVAILLVAGLAWASAQTALAQEGVSTAERRQQLAAALADLKTRNPEQYEATKQQLRAILFDHLKTHPEARVRFQNVVNEKLRRLEQEHPEEHQRLMARREVLKAMTPEQRKRHLEDLRHRRETHPSSRTRTIPHKRLQERAPASPASTRHKSFDRIVGPDSGVHHKKTEHHEGSHPQGPDSAAPHD